MAVSVRGRAEEQGVISEGKGSNSMACFGTGAWAEVCSEQDGQLRERHVSLSW